jgi:hypothetical protein
VTNGLFALGGALLAGGITLATTALNARHERESSRRQRAWQVEDRDASEWQALRAEREATYTRWLVMGGEAYTHAKSLAGSGGGSTDQDLLASLETLRMSVRMAAPQSVRKAVGSHHKYLRHLIRTAAEGEWPASAEKDHRQHEKWVTNAMRGELFPQSDRNGAATEDDLDDE